MTRFPGVVDLRISIFILLKILKGQKAGNSQPFQRIWCEPKIIFYHLYLIEKQSGLRSSQSQVWGC